MSVDEIVLKYWAGSPWETVEKTDLQKTDVQKTEIDIQRKKELECRFGYINPISRLEFENVIKKMKSLGFTQLEDEETICLRIVPSKPNKWGTQEEMIPMSSRIQIVGDNYVADYLNKSTSLKDMIENNPDAISFEEKKLNKNEKGEQIKPAMFPDFNFKISYTEETKVHSDTILEDFHKSTKNYFRLIHRITFSRDDMPFLIDFSVVEGNQGLVFQKDKNPKYEIEIEVKNQEIGPNELSKCKTNTNLAFLFRKMIKYILGGLQDTNFPIGLLEQEETLQEYKDIVSSERFIGPNLKTLQIENWIDDTTLRSGKYGVSEKADGERHLLFISSKGKIYLIKQNLKIIFTGCISKQESFCFTILDGELILHDKDGKFMNMFAVFDIYFLGEEAKTKKNSKKDKSTTECRNLPFYPLQDEEKVKKQKYRYKLLETLFKKWEPSSIIQDDSVTPMLFALKQFLFPTSKKTIFKCNKSLLQCTFPYKTDGLIFTSCQEHVNDNCSLKWKTLQQNTNDFVVSFIKDDKDEEEEDKEDAEEAIVNKKHYEFLTGKKIKRAILKCGYTKAQLHMEPKSFILNYLNGNAYSDFEQEGSTTYISKQFIPTNPYSPYAGMCYFYPTEMGECFTEETNELILDKSVVEFRYDLQVKNWIPVRLRNDKVEYGNNFNTANSNWKFMHCPVTEEMLITDKPLDPQVQDLYYNPVGKASVMKTNQMKLFHNFVKRRLLEFVLQKGKQKTLIDLGCGKAGDLHKWLHNKLEFVLGIDLFQDNIVNNKDGCYARFLDQCFFYNKQTKQMEKKLGKKLECVFVQGDCGKDIKSGEGITLSQDFEIVERIFQYNDDDEEVDKESNGVKDEKDIMKTLKKVLPSNGLFDVCSCQFALHYFFKSEKTLKAFLTNVYNTCKIGGYFIGCCFDGKKVFELPVHQLEILDEQDNRIFLLKKGYPSTKSFPNSSDSIGLKISVFQESINSLVDEYLVNFEYLESIMELYGFFPVENDELFGSHKLFRDIYQTMQEQLLSQDEKTISFLNRIFIFQKKTNIANPQRIDIS